MHDISNFMSWFTAQWFQIHRSMIAILKSFSWNGITFFDFLLTLILLPFIVWVVFAGFDLYNQTVKDYSPKGGKK